MYILDSNLNIIQYLGEHASEKSFLFFIFISVGGLLGKVLYNRVTITDQFLLTFLDYFVVLALP